MRRIQFVMALAWVALGGCSDTTYYDGEAVGVPGGDPLRPAAEVDPTPVDLRPVVQSPVVVPTPVEVPCGMEAFLSEETMDVGNTTAFETATIEEVQDGNGLLTRRVLRWSAPNGSLSRMRDIMVTPEQCIGLMTTVKYNERGLLTESRFEIFDEFMAIQVGGYMTLQSVAQRFHYDGEDRLVHVEYDLDLDDVTDIHREQEYDRAGRTTRLETWSAHPDVVVENALLVHPGQLETWAWNEDGNLLRHSLQLMNAGYTDTTENEYDGFGRLRTSTRRRDGVPVQTTDYDWRVDGQPRSERFVGSDGRAVSKTWYYDDRQRVERQEIVQDFDGDGRTDRINYLHYDHDGRVVLAEEDQPFDGTPDFREHTRYDDRGLKVWYQAIFPRDGRVAREMRWTYDEEGRQTEEAMFTQNRSDIWRTEYDDDGRVIARRWFDAEASLQREILTVFDARGGMVLQTYDWDADGALDQRTSQVFDQGGNLLLTQMDLGTDDTMQTRHLRHYQPF